MQRKGWLVPILVFFISIAGLLTYQRSNETTAFADTTNLPPILWSKSPSDITKLTFSEFGHNIVATRTPDGWQLSQPISANGDSLYIYNIISSFTQPAFIETIDSSSSKLIDYGIDSSSPTIKLYDGENEYEIVRGYAANASTYYVYSPLSEMIYTMSKLAFDNIKTDLSLWRDRTLLAFHKSEIEKIHLDYKNATYVITPHMEENVLSFTSEGLESKQLSSLISFLEASKIKDFIVDEATPALLQNYGFSTPTATVSIFLKTGKKLELKIGQVLKEENLSYIQVNQANSIVTIPYFNLEQLITIPVEEPISSEQEASSGDKKTSVEKTN